MSDAQLKVAFGKEKDPQGNHVVGIEIAVEPSSKVHTLHPVDQVSILLAPEQPSRGDHIRAFTLLQGNLSRLSEKPLESAKVIKKFMDTAHIGPLGLVRLFKK